MAIGEQQCSSNVATVPSSSQPIHQHQLENFAYTGTQSMEEQQHSGHVAPSILTLPTELQQQIGMLLSFVDLNNLSFTCDRLLDNLSPPYVNDYKFHEAESRDSTACGVGRWPCYECRRVRPAQRFTDKSRRLHKGRASQSCRGRFCIDCGMKPSDSGVRYHIEVKFNIKKKLYIGCRKCSCARAYGGVDPRMQRDVCQDCYNPTAKFKRCLQQLVDKYEHKKPSERLNAAGSA